MNDDHEKAKALERALAILVVGALLVISVGEALGQPYIEAGVSVHHQQWAEPEIELSNPLGHVEAGYQFRTTILGSEPSVFVRHQSSIPQYEDGYGLSEVGIQARWEWK